MINMIPPIYRNPLISNSSGETAGQTQTSDRIQQGAQLGEAERKEIRNHEDGARGMRTSDDGIRHLEPGFHPVVEELPQNPTQEEQKRKRRPYQGSNPTEDEETPDIATITSSIALQARDPSLMSLAVGNEAQLRSIAIKLYSEPSLSSESTGAGKKVNTEG